MASQATVEAPLSATANPQHESGNDNTSSDYGVYQESQPAETITEESPSSHSKIAPEDAPHTGTPFTKEIESTFMMENETPFNAPLALSLTRVSTVSRKRGNVLMVFVILTQLVQMFAYGAGIIAALTIGRSVGASDAVSTWIAAAYPLTQGAFVLISGRMGTVFGHKNMMALGCAWWVFWTLATAYSKNIVGISVMRGLAGIGGGFIVPNALALFTITFPPGKQRNLGLALFAAMGPVGGAGGATIVGLLVQWSDWSWLFFFLATLGLVVFGTALILVPSDEPLDPQGKVDWVGSYLGVAGLILFNFVWNQAPIVGWNQPYEYVLLIVAIAHFVGFMVWEKRWAATPILPFDIWTSPSFGPIIVVLFFVFMSTGIYIWYVTVFLINIRNWSAVLAGISFLPFSVSGVISSFFAAWAVSRVPAQIILTIGCLGTVAMNVLLGTTPREQTYFAMIFPAMILAAFTGDMVFAAGQIIASSVVSRKNQGAAASLIGTIFTYGLSTGLGFAGTVEANINRNGTDLLAGYRAASYLGIGFAAAALLVGALFVRAKKNTVEGWHGEDAVPRV